MNPEDVYKESEFLIPEPPRDKELFETVNKYRKKPSEKYNRWRDASDTALLTQRKKIFKFEDSAHVLLEFGENEFYPLATRLSPLEKTILSYLTSRKLINEELPIITVSRFSHAEVMPGFVRVTIKRRINDYSYMRF